MKKQLTNSSGAELINPASDLYKVTDALRKDLKNARSVRHLLTYYNYLINPLKRDLRKELSVENKEKVALEYVKECNNALISAGNLLLNMKLISSMPESYRMDYLCGVKFILDSIAYQTGYIQSAFTSNKDESILDDDVKLINVSCKLFTEFMNPEIMTKTSIISNDNTLSLDKTLTKKLKAAAGLIYDRDKNEKNILQPAEVLAKHTSFELLIHNLTLGMSETKIDYYSELYDTVTDNKYPEHLDINVKLNK